jgi:hypothetical protein
VQVLDADKNDGLPVEDCRRHQMQLALAYVHTSTFMQTKFSEHQHALATLDKAQELVSSVESGVLPGTLPQSAFEEVFLIKFTILFHRCELTVALGDVAGGLAIAEEVGDMIAKAEHPTKTHFYSKFGITPTRTSPSNPCAFICQQCSEYCGCRYAVLQLQRNVCTRNSAPRQHWLGRNCHQNVRYRQTHRKACTCAASGRRGKDANRCVQH